MFQAHHLALSTGQQVRSIPFLKRRCERWPVIVEIFRIKKCHGFFGMIARQGVLMRCKIETTCLALPDAKAAVFARKVTGWMTETLS